MCVGSRLTPATFSQVNAWDKDGVITLYVSRQNSAFGADSGDYSEVGRLHRWTIDLRRGSVSEQPIDDRPADFGRVNDNLLEKSRDLDTSWR